MEPEAPAVTVFKPSELKLFVYGSRQSDQFWLPTENSHSRKPFCLTDVEKFTFNKDQDEEIAENKQSKQPIPNPLFNQTVYKVACGSIHSIVLTTEGKVFTFGCNDEGALGRKGIECIPAQVKLQDPIDLIAAGDNHSLFANSSNGAIYFTGNYNYKRGQMMTTSIFEPVRTYATQINITNKHKKIQKLSCGANHSCILIGGKVFCRGQPEASTIGRRISKRHKVENSLTFNGVNLTNVFDIQCGGYHTVVKTKKDLKNRYYAWGTNDHGQLGIGSFQSQAYPTEIKKLREKNIVKIAAGASFTLFLSEEGELYGCGNNQDSNLGLGQDFQYQESQSQKEQQESQSQQKQQKKEQQQKFQPQPPQPVQLPAVTQQPQQALQPQNLIPPAQSLPTSQPQVPPSPVPSSPKKELKSSSSYIKSITPIPLPSPAHNIAAGDNFGFAWNKNNLYTWGMGYGYVLLNGQENDESQPFQVKNKIIRNHTIYQLDAGNQHVLYTSYPSTIQDQVKIQPKPSVWENLSVAKHGLKRRR